MNETRFLSDNTQEDFFRFDLFGKLIANSILASTPIPKSVAIFGKWGAGKTTLMKIVEKEIQNQAKLPQNIGQKIVTSWFDSWRYANEPNILIPLLFTIHDSLEGESANSFEDLKILLKAFLESTVDNLEMNVTLGLATINLPKAMKAIGSKLSTNKPFEDKSAFYDIFKWFQRVLEKNNYHIVIFVDDLDRCQPDRLLAVVEAIKLMMDMERITVVIGADHLFLMQAVTKHYDNLIDGQAFVKKIFPVSFVIPYPDEQNITTYINALLEKIGCGHDEKQQVAQIFKLGGEYNPREIKRLINSYAISRNLVEGFTAEKSAAKLSFLMVVQQEWPIEAQYIAQHPDNFIDYLMTVYEGRETNFVATHQEFVPSKTFIDYIRNTKKYVSFKDHWELRQYMNLISRSAFENLLQQQIKFTSEKKGDNFYKVYPSAILEILSHVHKVVYRLPEDVYSNFDFEKTEKENFCLETTLLPGTEIEIDVFFKSNPDMPVGYIHRIP